jgi:hydroxymethylpyrimidine/phosphomethylpyrimidine kinase
MLGSGEIAAAVAEILRDRARDIPIILDPVLVSTSGTPLLDARGIEILRTELIPLAALVTPNIPEAEMLTGVRYAGPLDIVRAGEVLLKMGAKAVLLKGGHARGDMLVDTLMTGSRTHIFESPRIHSKHTHGTGCTYATAIAVELAKGVALEKAVERAHQYVRDAIVAAPGFGRGNGPLNHMCGLS